MQSAIAMRLLMLTLLFSPQVQRTELCTVSGTVVDGITGEPLNKVDILLEPVDRQATHVAITVSDAKGRFALVELAPTTYRVVSRRNGYIEGAIRVRVEAAQALSGLTVQLTPAGVIAGTVRDSDGEPLEGAHVTLARRTFRGGRLLVKGEDSIDTDDRGEYRFRGLTAGRYYIGVEAKPHGWDQVDHSAVAAAETSSAPAFYPGVTELSQAMPIEIAAGRRVIGIDVKLPRVRGFQVSGRVVNGGSARWAVILRDAANSGMRDYALRTSTQNEHGDFEFRGVPQGTYELSVTGALNGRAQVVVGSANVEGVVLTLAAGAEVQLRITAGAAEKPELSELHYSLSSDRTFLSATPWQTERFTMRNVPPDRYTLDLDGPLLRRYYVKSARAGETDVLADGLRVSGPGSVRIEVVLASDGAAIEGIVQDQDARPKAGATVLLAPDRRARADLFRSTTADQNGRFEFSAVTPGDYKVFAWESAEEDAWQDPDFLRQYEKQGQKAVLEAKGRGVVNVRVAVKPDQP